jgi:oleate hydratase
MFMPRAPGDRPSPVPQDTKNFAFISQFVELPLDTVFTVEYSIRAAQLAVYGLLGISRPIPPVTRHDKSLRVELDALIKAMR